MGYLEEDNVGKRHKRPWRWKWRKCVTLLANVLDEDIDEKKLKRSCSGITKSSEEGNGRIEEPEELKKKTADMRPGLDIRLLH